MIVVTGASGVIGRSLVAQLHCQGIEYFSISRPQFDLSSGRCLTDYIPIATSAIIHLAAAVPHSPHYPDNDVSAGKTQSIDKMVYSAAQKLSCRLVYASTCSLYDKRSPEIKFEETPLSVRENSPYMRAKFQGEQLFSKLASYCIIRVPAPIGVGLPDTVVAKRFFDSALRGDQINVWGSGKREQNYVEVTEIADAFLRAALVDFDGVINVAADRPTTMLELAQAISRVLTDTRYVVAGDLDELEGEFARYSNRLAREVLGWLPKVSVENSIRKMYEYETSLK